MNIMQIMQQAQGLKKKVDDLNNDMIQKEVYGETLGGAIKVVCDGRGKFKSIKLSAQVINPEHPELVDEDTVETLEDAISTAILQTSQKASAEFEAQMNLITGGLKIPGM